MSEKVNVLILVGSQKRGRRFRPISLDLPKPLFPLANKPMIYHHLVACKKLDGVQEIFLLGGYKKEVFKNFIEHSSQELDLKISYLEEVVPMGTGGGLFYFQDTIFKGANYIILLHSDIICSFPLQQIVDFHKSHKQICTMLGVKVDKESALNYGCFVHDETTKKMLHYIEKPETFVSDTVNGGIYCFSSSVVLTHIKRTPSQAEMFNPLDIYKDVEQEDSRMMSLEKGLIPPLVTRTSVYVYMYNDFWRSIKTAASALYCSQLYLNYYNQIKEDFITKKGQYHIEGLISVHPTAHIDPTAMLGSNVTIGSYTKIGAGVRVSNSIILNNVVLKERSCISNSIICSDSVIGQWCRVEGAVDETTPAHLKNKSGVTIFGEGVIVDPEIIVRNCIVMPHKHLSHNYFNEILL
eukprot:TRINITY_DN7725_c0_g1_i1.p1 TRINITY_DN7725_c0_g1~~TRINITY_DN7725_c0_g1_i1.p1  ORF type:complete len:425 (-),score=46.52 TRINITY_DN7725_c0_g1_i1:47-1273(-)